MIQREVQRVSRDPFKDKQEARMKVTSLQPDMLLIEPNDTETYL